MTTMTDVSTGKFVEAAGLRTHYNEIGSGPPVIWLHGGGPGASGWSNFKANVGHFAARYRSILLDAPGFGQTDVPPDALTAPDHLKAFMDAVGIEKATLVGNSMGGSTSLRFVFKYPERVDKLVLMGPGAMGPLYASTTPSVGNNAIMNFFRDPNPTKETLRRIFELILYRPEQVLTEETLEERFQAAMRPDTLEWRRRTVRAADQAGRQPPSLDLLSQCTKITAPTLLVWGAEDRFNPVEAGLQLVKLIPGSRLHVFSECGHWAQLEKLDEFNRLLMDFLDH